MRPSRERQAPLTCDPSGQRDCAHRSSCSCVAEARSAPAAEARHVPSMCRQLLAPHLAGSDEMLWATAVTAASARGAVDLKAAIENAPGDTGLSSRRRHIRPMRSAPREGASRRQTGRA